MTVHTPGPWAVDGALHRLRPLITSGTDLHIADLYTQGLGGAGPANARLIAAAPDLLAAALAMMEADRALHDSTVKHDEWDALDRRAIALLGKAIAKATAP